MARTVPLKFGPLFQNDHEAAIGGANTAAMHDGFFLVNPSTRERTWHRRPGLAEHIDLGTAKPVDGLFWWDKKQAMAAISDGRTFIISDSTGTVTELTGDALEKMRRPSFATDGDHLLIANGGRIVTTDGATPPVYLTSENAPTACRFVGWIDTYFLAAMHGTDQYFYSAVGNNPDTWAALDFETAMASPDNTVALRVDGGEIMLFGNETVEVHYDDGVSPFARNDAATMNHGCLAPYSALKAKGVWLWLNERREVVTPDGRTPTPISEPIARVLQELGEASDAMADSFTLAGQTFYTLTFPTAGKTLVLNLTTGEWCGEWGYWKNGEYRQWLGNCHAHAPHWSQNLVGSRIDGKIYLLSESNTTDAGAEIRAAIRTGNITHGTLQTKLCRALRLNFRRLPGYTDPATIMIRWRESGSPSWGREVFVNIGGNDGDTTLTVPLRGLGTYRSRQYEIIMTDAAPLVFMGAEEEVDLL